MRQAALVLKRSYSHSSKYRGLKCCKIFFWNQFSWRTYVFIYYWYNNFLSRIFRLNPGDRGENRNHRCKLSNLSIVADATEKTTRPKRGWKKNGVNLILIPTSRCKSCKKIVCCSRTDSKYVKAAKIEIVPFHALLPRYCLEKPLRS